MFLQKTSMRAAESSYSGGYSTGGSSSMGWDLQPGLLLAVVVISLIISILVFVLLVKKKKAPRGRFSRWLREYLNFRSILVSGIIKFVYLFLAVLLTIMSVVVMCMGRDDSVLPMILAGLAMLVVGNILLRITLELTMALIMVWANTSDIRSVIVREDEKPDEVEEVKESKAPKKETKETPEEVKKASVVQEVTAEQQQAAVSQAENQK